MTRYPPAGDHRSRFADVPDGLRQRDGDAKYLSDSEVDPGIRIGGDGPPLPSEAPGDGGMAAEARLAAVDGPTGRAMVVSRECDVLGVLIARVSGQSLGTFLHERIFDPLGMKEHRFHVPPKRSNVCRPVYFFNRQTNALGVFRRRGEQRMASRAAVRIGWRRARLDDRRLFCLLPHDAEQRPARPRTNSFPRHRGTDDVRSTHARATNRRLKSSSVLIAVGAFGMAVEIRANEIFRTPGRFGWDGRLWHNGIYRSGTEGMIGILFTQRMMDSPEPPKVFTDFWTLAYGAME